MKNFGAFAFPSNFHFNRTLTQAMKKCRKKCDLLFIEIMFLLIFYENYRKLN